MKKILSFLTIMTIMLFASCTENEVSDKGMEGKPEGNMGFPNGEIGAPNEDISGEDNTSFGEDITEEVNKGYFEEPVQGIEINCISGTQDAYELKDGVLTFTNLSEDSVYSVSGQLKGCIIIDIGNEYKLDLELRGLSLVSEDTNPIMVLSGDKVTLTAKKGFESFIYDEREAVDENDESQYSGAIYALCDLEIAGKGELTLVSKNNNGIHTKDDLEIKNLTLTITACDNALKGNDSVTIEGGKTILIATNGDGIKTTNSDISDKGNQRGAIVISGGEHTIYAACDGMDSAYNVEINDETTILNIYTDKYSNYSKEVTATSEDVYYIRHSSNSLSYSVKYYNSDTDYVWVNPAYHSTVSGGRQSYYYYSFAKKPEYSKMQVYIYSSEMEQGQENEYYACTDYLTINPAYDTFAISSYGGSLGYTWTNYTTTVSDGMGRPGGMGGHGGMGGMNDGNTDKGSYSTKGIKANNQIVINAGTINIKAYDDAIHANNDEALENGSSPLGNVTVNGGLITAYSNDDGLHADGTLNIAGGSVFVTNSYEGVEGAYINVSGGSISVVSKDDGMNSTTTTGTAITISGGNIYIYCGGDGIDANTRSSYSGIVFNGGNTAIISTSGGNSALDTEQGYSYIGGKVVAVMPSGGMTSEATHCSNFSSIGTNSSISLKENSYLTINTNGELVAAIKMPSSMNGCVIYLGSSSASVSAGDSTSFKTDANGVYWSN